MRQTYDAGRVQAFYDGYGVQEWERLGARPSAEVNFFVHRQYLERFVRPGDHVLEVGAGPGRFTIELARLGARVTVTDLSPVQLALNARYVEQAGCGAAVVARHRLDVLDLSPLGARFNAVVCYGGVLGYLRERAGEGVREMARVLCSGGHLLASTMSHLYNLRKRDIIARLLPTIRTFGLDTARALIEGGAYEGPFADGHELRLYSAAQVEALLAAAGLEPVAVSASNCLSVGNDDLLGDLRDDPLLWPHFLAWELHCSAQPGALDGGHHVLVVGRSREVPGAA